MKIEIWSDFVCPFCYIGKRRLEAAIEHLAYADEITVEYKSYQLDPNAKYIPDKDFYEMFSELKGIPLSQTVSINQQVAFQAQSFDLDFNFQTMKYANTFDAHRVAKLAEKKGKGKELTERFLFAYFTESKLLSDHDTLAELATEAGLDRDEVVDVLNTNRFARDVRNDISEAQQIGVRGVPFYVLNETYAISGAQPLDIFIRALEKVREEEKDRPVLKKLGTGADYCVDGCCEVKEK
ncbi:disulfide bond formation protein DsbA [Bacillus sp. FJAT-27225]|uniref:DsbA family oxidoreductase n=1 Tax=Bacillus sp. FJAT-27225 TaxID=1743144 RepID=UPI00080C261B|nr:DsbA family oxidoreductase [Bacillus sp. FJAT-27225]OCA83217.1 disulfide bond formation protein DsbA [Bacillus sp. FJAT-27225]